MKINIEKIKDTPGAMMDVKLKSELEDRKIHGMDVSFVSSANLDLKVINSEKSYIIAGQVQQLLELPCSRCLEKFEMPLEFELNLEVDKDEVENDEIDINTSLEENIVLALPMQVVCTEDCKGLCPSCGINLNYEDCDCIMHKVDPRLAKLEKLLDKDK